MLDTGAGRFLPTRKLQKRLKGWNFLQSFSTDRPGGDLIHNFISTIQYPAWTIVPFEILGGLQAPPARNGLDRSEALALSRPSIDRICFIDTAVFPLGPRGPILFPRRKRMQKDVEERHCGGGISICHTTVRSANASRTQPLTRLQTGGKVRFLPFGPMPPGPIVTFEVLNGLQAPGGFRQRLTGGLWIHRAGTAKAIKPFSQFGAVLLTREARRPPPLYGKPKGC